nr:ribonuclease H-like domain-containing protein [Tanacetum cinerariifolium]
MTGNISYLSDYEPFDGGYVSFGQGECKITNKGTIKTDKLEFENVYFVNDLKYNLFSVSQICDNKNSVLFTDSECIVLGQNFKLSDDDNVLLRTPRRHNMYSIDLNNIVPYKDLTCLVAKASADEWKFKAKGDEGYFIGYSMSSKAFRVIEFGDSYEVPASAASAATTDTVSDGTGKKKGRTVTVIDDDMQKRKNDVKARTTLLLPLPDEHQLRFSKYKTTPELWAAILKTFGGNEATKKTKKNLLKQQYGNFKAKGLETLEQTFNRLQVIVGQLQFIDVEIEHDALNQKFLTSLAPEWLMHTIVWRNRSDLNTMSLDDLYNHLKVYEPEVQKKSEPNS